MYPQTPILSLVPVSTFVLCVIPPQTHQFTMESKWHLKCLDTVESWLVKPLLLTIVWLFYEYLSLFTYSDGLTPSDFINTPDSIDTGKVTRPKLGNVYIMWKVDNGPYRKGSTSAPIHQPNSTSVLSILTLSKEEYEASKTTITCAVIHANMNNRRAPLQVSTSKSIQPELYCD